MENVIIWLGGNVRFIATTNLTILFQTETQKQMQQHRYSKWKGEEGKRKGRIERGKEEGESERKREEGGRE